MIYLTSILSLDLVNIANHLIQKLTNVFCERVNTELNESTHNVLRLLSCVAKRSKTISDVTCLETTFRSLIMTLFGYKREREHVGHNYQI